MLTAPACEPVTRVETRLDATAFRAALDAWLDASATCERHTRFWPDSDRPLAVHRRHEKQNQDLCHQSAEASQRLIEMVLDAYNARRSVDSDDADNGLEWSRTIPVAVDIGDVLLVVSPHHWEIDDSEPQEGVTLAALSKADIIRL